MRKKWKTEREEVGGALYLKLLLERGGSDGTGNHVTAESQWSVGPLLDSKNIKSIAGER